MPKLKARVTLGLLMFGMFFMYQMSRFNINIAIVAIAHEQSIANETSTLSFDTKPLILGSFFWLSWITELMGAFIVGKFGCRNILTITFLLNAFACFVFPYAYYLHPYCAIVVRILQGLILGTAWPAMGWLSPRWIPKTERSRFMSTYHGSSFGASFTNLFGGMLIDQLGWPYVFYGTGLLSIVWVILWWMNGYDTPIAHPRISAEERSFLEQNVEVSSMPNKKPLSVPWCAILASTPFWAIFVMFFTLMWYNVTLAMQMPTYFDSVHSLDIKTNGLLLSIPDMCRMVVGIKYPMIMDGLIKKGTLSVSASRRISCVVGYVIPGILMIFVAFFGNLSIGIAAALLIIQIAISGAGSSSILANIVDISPNFSSAIMGVSKTFSNLPGILSPIIVKEILADNVDNWRYVFLITACLVLSTCTFYLIFTSTDIQSWNNQYDEKTNEKPDETVDLIKLPDHPDKPKQNDCIKA